MAFFSTLEIGNEDEEFSVVGFVVAEGWRGMGFFWGGRGEGEVVWQAGERVARRIPGGGGIFF